MAATQSSITLGEALKKEVKAIAKQSKKSFSEMTRLLLQAGIDKLNEKPKPKKK